MQVSAKLNNLKIAPRKVRLVAHVIKGMSADAALTELSKQVKRSSEPMSKLLRSAIANAEHNFGLDSSNLFVSSVLVGDGKRLKRWQPRAFGRANQILHRLSNITLVVEERIEGLNRKETRTTEVVAKKKAEPGGAPAGVRTFQVPGGGGGVAYVGRNNRGNEVVSHKLSRAAPAGTALWFHARGVPGAHVLLRLPQPREATEAERQFGADLAAYFSRQKTAAKALVSVALPHHVSRAPGGRLGAVLLEREEQAVVARPDSVRAIAEESARTAEQGGDF